MDSPGCAGRDPGRGNLGTHGLGYQQPRRAVPGEDHGRRCPIPVISGQGGVQRSGAVYLGFAALLRRNRGRDPELLGRTKAEASPSEVRASDAGYDEGSRGSAVTSGGNPGCEFRTVVSRVAASGTLSATGRILGATENPAASCACVSSSSPEAGQTKAAQRGLLQHCRRAHKPDRKRVAGRARAHVVHRYGENVLARCLARSGGRAQRKASATEARQSALIRGNPQGRKAISCLRPPWRTCGGSAPRDLPCPAASACR